MRYACGAVLLMMWGAAAAQIPKATLADQIGLARTIVAKLDHAVQSDPPPNFASSILVTAHKEATSFIDMADATVDQLRKGGAVDAGSVFAVYSQFRDLYERYELFEAQASKPLELNKVDDAATAREFFEVKTYLEVATTVAISNQADQARACGKKVSR